MGLFSRKPPPPSYIAEPFLRGLRDFGEYLVGRRGDYNVDLLADLEMVNFAQDSPDAFVDILASSISDGPSHVSSDPGPTSLGAAESIAGVFGLEVSSPSWHQILDTAIEYLRGNGIPYHKVKPYMRIRWEENHRLAEW